MIGARWSPWWRRRYHGRQPMSWTPASGCWGAKAPRGPAAAPPSPLPLISVLLTFPRALQLDLGGDFQSFRGDLGSAADSSSPLSTSSSSSSRRARPTSSVRNEQAPVRVVEAFGCDRLATSQAHSVGNGKRFSQINRFGTVFSLSFFSFFFNA